MAESTAERVELEKTYEVLVADVSPEGVSVESRIGLTGDTGDYTPNNAIEPPLSLEQLARLTDLSGTRQGCLSAMVTNVVGLGYSIEPVDRASPPDDWQTQAAKVKGHLEALAARDERLERPSFTQLISAVKLDEEEVGNGYMEVSRNRTNGEISGLFHLPAARMRRLRSRKGWVLTQAQDGSTPTQGIEYYDFGTKVAYDRDGHPLAKLQNPSKQRWDRNEVIHFRVYSSKSRDYGLPRDYPNTQDYLCDRLAAEANIGFFDAGGTPPHIIFVRGVEAREGNRVTFRVPPETPQHIASVLKGGDRHSRVAIIPLPPGTETDTVELGHVSDRDVGFVDYRADLRRRVLSAFRISPIFIADVEDAGRYTAEVERAITLEQVFDPDQTRWETRLWDTLMRDLGYTWARLVLTELAIEGNAVKRESAVRMAEAGVVTRAEYREAHGRGPLPEADEAEEQITWRDGQRYGSVEPTIGQVPHGWNARLVDTGRPRGAENRNPESDQRGLRPGVGTRERRHELTQAEREAEGGVGEAFNGGGRRATRRARRALAEVGQ